MYVNSSDVQTLLDAAQVLREKADDLRRMATEVTTEAVRLERRAEDIAEGVL